jgi:hypothetical protein
VSIAYGMMHGVWARETSQRAHWACGCPRRSAVTYRLPRKAGAARRPLVCGAMPSGASPARASSSIKAPSPACDRGVSTPRGRRCQPSTISAASGGITKVPDADAAHRRLRQIRGADDHRCTAPSAAHRRSRVRAETVATYTRRARGAPAAHKPKPTNSIRDRTRRAPQRRRAAADHPSAKYKNSPARTPATPNRATPRSPASRESTKALNVGAAESHAVMAGWFRHVPT